MDPLIEDGDDYEEVLTESYSGEERVPIPRGEKENELLDALNFGLSTNAIEMEKNADPDDGPQYIQSRLAPPPQTLEERIQEPIIKPQEFKVTAKMAEQGRKAVQEKLADETMEEKEEFWLKFSSTTSI